MRGQAAPIYWAFFMALMFGIIVLFILLSPMVETFESLGRNLTADLPLNGSVITSSNRVNLMWNLAPLILVVGLILAMVAVVKVRDFYTGEGEYA